MGNRFIFILLAYGLAFGAGWLFANEVRPPRLENVTLAMWAAVGVVGFLLAVMGSSARR